MRTVLVTGASGYLGNAIVAALATPDTHVVAHYRSDEAGAEKARAIASATVADVRAAMGVGPARRPSLR